LKRFIVAKKDGRGEGDRMLEKVRSGLAWLYGGKVKRSRNNKGMRIKKKGY